MASTGAKGQPLAASGDNSSLAAQLNAVSNYAATIATRRTGTITQRNAATSAGYVADGDEWKVPNGETYDRVSGSWVRRQITVTGQVTVAAAVAAGSVTAAIPVTFPAGTFTSPPRVYTESDTIRLNTSSGSETATGCNVFAANWSGAVATAGAVIKWKAVG